MLHGTVTEDRRGCCKPAWLSGTTPLFPIPRPLEENGDSFSFPENMTPWWLSASCCYGCVFFTISPRFLSVVLKSKQTTRLLTRLWWLDIKRQGGGLKAERLAFLQCWMNCAGYHISLQGKKICSEATGREFLAAFFTPWAVFWD